MYTHSKSDLLCLLLSVNASIVRENSGKFKEILDPESVLIIIKWILCIFAGVLYISALYLFIIYLFIILYLLFLKAQHKFFSHTD
jgi:hypothetical protein